MYTFSLSLDVYYITPLLPQISVFNPDKYSVNNHHICILSITTLSLLLSVSLLYFMRKDFTMLTMQYCCGTSWYSRLFINSLYIFLLPFCVFPFAHLALPIPPFVLLLNLQNIFFVRFLIILPNRHFKV